MFTIRNSQRFIVIGVFSTVCFLFFAMAPLGFTFASIATESVELREVKDVRIEKMPGKTKISIVTSGPLLFETSTGVNGEGMNFLTISFQYMRLAWSNGVPRAIGVDHGGVKEVILSQSYEHPFKVEAVVRLLPLANYNVYSAADAKGVVVEVTEVPLEVLPEAPVEEVAEVVSPLLVSIDLVDADIQQVLRTLSEQSGLNIVADSRVKGKVTVHLKDVPVEIALELVIVANGMAYTKIGNTILVGPEKKIIEQITTSEVIRLEHINAEAASDMLRGVIEGRHIQVNGEANCLVITGIPDKLKEAKRIIAEVDRPIPQVLLNAKVLELGVDASEELGIDWSQGIGVTFRESNREPSFGTEAISGSFFHLHRLARTAFEARLKALISEGNARILSNPRVVTMKDKEASIFIGDRVPYTITSVAGGVATTEVRFSEPGIRLKILPKIIKDDFVVIEIEPEVSYIYSWRGKENQYPWVKTREAKAKVRIKDGETLILGGLLSTEDKKTISKVPFISEIPVLGNLFKSTKLSEANTELIITVTPTIMKKR